MILIMFRPSPLLCICSDHLLESKRKMKIFNWVHKTFHHSSQKDGFDSKVRKAVPGVIKWENQASLKEVALADVHGGWKDGFLSIGTLGCYGPFKGSNQHKDYVALESDGDEAEEMKPLIHTKFENNFDDFVNEKPNLIDNDNAAKVEDLENNFDDFLNEKPNLIANDNDAKVEDLVTTPTQTLVSDDDDVITECIDVGTDEKEEKKSERITLADLFFADSEKIIKHDAAKVLLDDQTISDDHKQSLKAKHGQPTFTKKLISRVHKDTPHPIKSIRKLMKKMMKKKIHPDQVDVKNQKPSDASEVCENQEIEGTSG